MPRWCRQLSLGARTHARLTIAAHSPLSAHTLANRLTVQLLASHGPRLTLISQGILLLSCANCPCLLHRDQRKGGVGGVDAPPDAVTSLAKDVSINSEALFCGARCAMTQGHRARSTPDEARKRRDTRRTQLTSQPCVSFEQTPKHVSGACKLPAHCASANRVQRCSVCALSEREPRVPRCWTAWRLGFSTCPPGCTIQCNAMSSSLVLAACIHLSGEGMQE